MEHRSDRFRTLNPVSRKDLAVGMLLCFHTEKVGGARRCPRPRDSKRFRDSKNRSSASNKRHAWQSTAFHFMHIRKSVPVYGRDKLFLFPFMTAIRYQ